MFFGWGPGEAKLSAHHTPRHDKQSSFVPLDGGRKVLAPFFLRSKMAQVLSFPLCFCHFSFCKAVKPFSQFFSIGKILSRHLLFSFWSIERDPVRSLRCHQSRPCFPQLASWLRDIQRSQQKEALRASEPRLFIPPNSDQSQLWRWGNSKRSWAGTL